MNDLIRRQAAIEALEKYDFSFPEYMERFVTELRDAMKEDLKDDIANLPSAQPAQRWIPVTERLPNDERLVLVSCHYGSKLEDFVIPARYAGNPRDYNAIKQQYDIEWDEDDRWLTEGYTHFYGKQVVAWQYLPAPYVEPTDAPSASDIRGEMFYADMGDDE